VEIIERTSIDLEQEQVNLLTEDISGASNESDCDCIIIDYTSCSDTGEHTIISPNKTTSPVSIPTYSEVAESHGTKEGWSYVRRSSTPCRRPHSRNTNVNHKEQYIRRKNHESSDSQDRSDPIVYGQAVAVGIKAMNRDCYRQHNANRIASGIFVTRLNPATSVRQLHLHLSSETGRATKPEKLHSKHPSYSSFYIPCDRQTRNVLLDKALWPKGALVKLFYN